MGLDDMIRRNKSADAPRAVSPEPEPHAKALAQHIESLTLPAASSPAVPSTPPERSSTPVTHPEDQTPNPPGVTTPAPNVISFENAYESATNKIRYDETSFLRSIERGNRATKFMGENALGPKGDAKLDDFIEAIGDLYALATAYRALRILNAE